MCRSCAETMKALVTRKTMAQIYKTEYLAFQNNEFSASYKRRVSISFHIDTLLMYNFLFITDLKM